MANTSCIVKVAGITPETDRVSTFELTAADGGTLPPFTAGAHIDLHLGNGLVRSYSLLNDPDENHRYVIAVQKEIDGRGGSLRSEEHTSELQSLMRISYAVFCMKKKQQNYHV